jgi:uncharacterized membrane protein YgaE (UPF0421/DUF939 family)
VQEAVPEKQLTYVDKLNSLLDFHFSEKFKFAVKVSFAIMLAYLIPFSQGWVQAQTSVITIMLIAVAGPVSESISKGLKRVIGTIIGAIIGMTLIAIFPQERMLYLFSLSIFVSIALYLTRVYKGDNTVFMLMAVTMMMVFKNGEVDDVFLYGIDRTFMTIFGIVLYTLVSIFIWPVKSKDDTLDITLELLETQVELYRYKDSKEKHRKALYETLQTQEKKMEEAVITSVSDTSVLTFSQRNTILQDIKKINELLMLLSYYDEAHFADKYDYYIKNFDTVDNDIKRLFEALKNTLHLKKEIDIPERWEIKYDTEAIKTLSHIDRAAFTSTMLDISTLHDVLRSLAEKFNAIISPYPTSFTLSKISNPSKFKWLDVEDIKGTLVSFLIFWASTFFWIEFNPPAGFLIVTLATSLSVLTTFSPLKPSLLIIIFSFSFIFATAMYIFVLPNIHYPWELGLFIFLYAFIGFYFIPAMISVFFLLGMAILGLENPMYYNFQVFLMILFVFYLFLFVLLLFYYIPFSTKPEHLFLTMKKRFFRLSANLMQRSNNLSSHKGSFFGSIKANYAQVHLMYTVKKMQLWASKLDIKYFDTIDHKILIAFTKESETFAYLLQMMYKRELQSIDNPLIQAFRKRHQVISLAALLESYTKGENISELSSVWKDKKQIIEKIEESLKDFLSEMKPGQYSQSEIIEFYENISLRRNVWSSLLSCQKMLETLNFNVLVKSRF